MNADTQPQPRAGVVLAIIGAAVLTAVASVMPAGARKLVLFAVAFGMAIGWIAALAARQSAAPRRVILVLVPLLTIAGLSFVAQRSWREYQALQRAADMEDPHRSLPSPMLEAIAANDPGTAAMLRREQVPGFPQYLAVRTRPLGEWPDPWPVLFWLGELVLAGGAGLLVASRMLPVRPRVTETGEMVAEGTESA